MINYALFALIGYLSGSIPFGIIIPWLFKKGDPRKIGSASIGATNVYRLAGIKIAFIVYLLDFLKGAIPVIICPTSVMFAVGVGCILGHIFPWILNFKGGKGVSTACGVMAVMMPINTIVAFGAWFMTWKITKFVSVASLVAGVVQLLLTWIFFEKEYIWFSCFVFVMVLYTHRHNISRLISGTEGRVN